MEAALSDHYDKCGTGVDVDTFAAPEIELKSRTVSQGCGRDWYTCEPGSDEKTKLHIERTCKEWVYYRENRYAQWRKTPCTAPFRRCLKKTYDHHPGEWGKTKHSGSTELVDNTLNCEQCTDGCSTCDRSISAGDTYEVELTTDEPYYYVHWYVKSASETGIGTEIEYDGDGYGGETEASFSYTFSTAGSYVITARVYPYSNPSSYTDVTYDVTVE